MYCTGLKSEIDVDWVRCQAYFECEVQVWSWFEFILCVNISFDSDFKLGLQNKTDALFRMQEFDQMCGVQDRVCEVVLEPGGAQGCTKKVTALVCKYCRGKGCNEDCHEDLCASQHELRRKARGL